LVVFVDCVANFVDFDSLFNFGAITKSAILLTSKKAKSVYGRVGYHGKKLGSKLLTTLPIKSNGNMPSFGVKKDVSMLFECGG
jgi:hypothetical protein